MYSLTEFISLCDVFAFCGLFLAKFRKPLKSFTSSYTLVYAKICLLKSFPKFCRFRKLPYLCSRKQ